MRNRFEFYDPKNHPTPIIIGALYRYYNSRKTFKLEWINRHRVFFFECGHWCMESVFNDLILVDSQLKLFSG